MTIGWLNQKWYALDIFQIAYLHAKHNGNSNNSAGEDDSPDCAPGGMTDDVGTQGCGHHGEYH